jgi:hypothetical protein
MIPIYNFVSDTATAGVESAGNKIRIQTTIPIRGFLSMPFPLCTIL